ncbi:MAG: MerR family transcriptional regulator, partial [Anaerolineae bacterium]|nr:MerR family transcriptional regulator [Anaerolineae bacterium]
LEQIAQLLDEGIENDDIQTMLVKQKSELESRILEDLQRLRRVEMRIKSPEMGIEDVVVKNMPPQKFLSVDHFCLNAEDGMAFALQLIQELPKHMPQRYLQQFVVMSNNDDFIAEKVDLIFGIFVDDQVPDEINMGSGFTLTTTVLPAINHLATIAHVGSPLSAHQSYGVLARWIEANHYVCAGNPRDTFLHIPKSMNEDDIIMEVQIPVKPQLPDTFRTESSS